MKRLVLSLALISCVLCGSSLQERADEAAPQVTRENFSALVFETSGGLAGIVSQIEIHAPRNESKRFSLDYIYTVQKRGLARNVDLTADEEAAVLIAVNAANLPALDGKEFWQKQLADGFNEVLTLTLVTGEKYVVQNYGDKAPSEYYALTRFLRELQEKKFPQS